MQRSVVFKIIENYLKYPKYSYRAIGDDVGCNKKTVQRYVRKWESNEDIPQLEEGDVIELQAMV